MFPICGLTEVRESKQYQCAVALKEQNRQTIKESSFLYSVVVRYRIQVVFFLSLGAKDISFTF